ncbi:MAG: hypothetical protein ACI35R_13300 [Bacillus sp. (in: firmicutes)]
MKKRLLYCFALMLLLGLVGCSDETATKKDNTPKEKNEGFTYEEYEARVTAALKEMGDKTKLKIISKEKAQDGTPALALSENIFILVKTDKKTNYVKSTTLGALSQAYFTENDELNNAFLLLVGTTDESLSFGDRNKVISELGLNNKKTNLMDHTEVYKHNGIQYTYKGDLKEDNMLLQAEIK